MSINIGGHNYDKEWLLGTPRGQEILRLAKQVVTRPRCMCNSAGAEMYIATRGTLHYLARMPNTALLHSDDCVSHLVPCRLYSADSPQTILESLLSGVDSSGKWNEFRRQVMQVAKEIRVDGQVLGDKLLVPSFFNKDRSDAQRESYDAFFALSATDDGTQRRWLLAPLKSATPSKYGARVVIKHMSSIVFWSVKELAQLLIDASGKNEAVLGLFEVKKTASGILLTDCALHSLVSEAESAADEAEEQAIGEEEKVRMVKEYLGLPATTPIGDVFSAMLDYCVTRAKAK